VVTFTVDNNFTHVDHPEEIRMGLDKYFVIKKDGFVKGIDFEEYRATGRTVLKAKYHPEIINLYNFQERIFPTGRLGYLLDWMDSYNIPCQVVDVRIRPERRWDIEYVGPPSDGSNGLPARPYQLRAPQIIRDCTRGILWHATASGKTNTASRIIADLGVNTLYLVPSKELLDQTVKSVGGFLNLHGGHIGKIGDGTWDAQPVTVATTATLWSRFDTPECQELLKQTELLIGDEIHHTGAKDKGKTTKNSKGASFAVNSWYILALHCPAY
jgi:hypothetical protein